MDRLSCPSPSEGTVLTASMIRRGTELIIQSWERAEKKRRKYYRTLRPYLDKLSPNDFDGVLYRYVCSK